jgi:hypothetical protein
MATTLTLILMAVVATIFGAVSRSVHESRATLEMTGRLRDTKEQMRRDLGGLTVTVSPPVDPETGEGYLEIVEGSVGAAFSAGPPPSTLQPWDMAVNSDTGEADTTVGDFDDLLMFTARSPSGSFVGRYRDGTIESDEAEIIWFVRGRTLYRRVLLICPQTMSDMDDNHNGTADATDGNGLVDLVDTGGAAFHALYDISARPQVDPSGNTPYNFGWVPNSLADLTNRENRYAHAVHPAEVFPASTVGFPYSVGRWGQLGLPTLRECSHPLWMTWADSASRPGVTAVSQIDLWNNPHPWVDTTTTPPTPQVDRVTGTLMLPPPPAPPAPPRFMGPRIAEDVILTNVLGFDIKVWDPGAPVFYRDLDGNGLVDPGEPAILPGDPGYTASLSGGSAPISFGAYVDLGYAPFYYSGSVPPTVPPGAPAPQFSTGGNLAPALVRVYDTWSFYYEHDGISQDDDDGSGVAGDAGDVIDEGTNGFDDPVDATTGGHYPGPNPPNVMPNGLVDEPAEMEAPPPYPVPLRGIQIKIRCYEPDSRQVREVTVVHDFLPK